MQGNLHGTYIEEVLEQRSKNLLPIAFHRSFRVLTPLITNVVIGSYQTMAALACLLCRTRQKRKLSFLLHLHSSGNIFAHRFTWPYLLCIAYSFPFYLFSLPLFWNYLTNSVNGSFTSLPKQWIHLTVPRRMSSMRISPQRRCYFGFLSL
jgi:hypothetical protein